MSHLIPLSPVSDNIAHSFLVERHLAAGNDSVYGMHWGDPEKDEHLIPVLDWIKRECADKRVIEIGSGGGRWTQHLAKIASNVIAVDYTGASETCIREHVDCTNMQFLICRDGTMDYTNITERLSDVAFSFDTFVHFTPDLFIPYVESVADSLETGGLFLLHYAQYYPNISEYNTEFKYWHEKDVIRLLNECGFSDTEFTLDFPNGWGSKLKVFRMR